MLEVCVCVCVCLCVCVCIGWLVVYVCVYVCVESLVEFERCRERDYVRNTIHTHSCNLVQSYTIGIMLL